MDAAGYAGPNWSPGEGGPVLLGDPKHPAGALLGASSDRVVSLCSGLWTWLPVACGMNRHPDTLVPMNERDKEGPMAGRTVVRAGSGAGILWVIGWMFTIAFAQLMWWQALLGLVVWPYYLGLAALALH